MNFLTGNGNTQIEETYKWKGVIENIVIHNNVCGACLKKNDKLQNLNAVFIIHDESITLKDTLKNVFGSFVETLLPTSWLCDGCTDIVLRSYIFIQDIKKNYNIFQKSIDAKSVGLRNGNNKYTTYLELKDLFNLNDKTVEDFDADVEEFVKSDADLDNNEDIPLSNLKKKLKTKYECCYCDESFSKFNLWKLHFCSNSTFKCRKCNKIVSKLEALVNHRRTLHGDKVTFCIICKVILHGKKTKKHFIHYHREDRLVCDFCNKSFYSRLSIEGHIALKHLGVVNINYYCQLCLKPFNSNFHFETHRCTFRCTDCESQPCIHEKYLISFREQQNSGRKPFKCINCDFTYINKRQVIAHANRQHLYHYPHLCDFCGESFVSRERLKYHNKYKHRQILYCMHCSKAFKDQNTLETHLSLCEITEKPYQCDLCKSNFTSQTKVDFHRRKHFSKEFQCQFCLKKYWTKSELNIHRKQTHSDKIECIKTKLHQCTRCPLDFTTKKDMLHHTLTHAKDSNHICRYCNATFKSKINYYAHVRRHKIKKDKECTVCFKLYDKYNIENHIKSHEIKKKEVAIEKSVKSNKNTMCDVCGKLLINEKSLITHRETHKEQQQCPTCHKFINTVLYEKHMKTHESETVFAKIKRTRKKLKCEKCEYTTFFTECLKAHENRFHLQIRPFQCDICKKGFYSKLTLKEHIKIHSGLKPEQCHECGNRFVNKKALKMHVRIHTGEKPYVCDLCNEKFLSASRRQAHRIRKHFEPSVQCPVCLKLYYTQSVLRSHVRDCHSDQPRQKNKKIS